MLNKNKNNHAATMAVIKIARKESQGDNISSIDKNNPNKDIISNAIVAASFHCDGKLYRKNEYGQYVKVKP